MMNSSSASFPTHSVQTDLATPARPGVFAAAAVATGLALVLSALAWQAVTSHGNPDPLAQGISRPAAVLNTGIVVFREGLEAILVLAALTASLLRQRKHAWKPIVIGALLSLVASVVTWFVVVAVVDRIDAPILQVQAATGLLAIVVLLVILNWFFHRIYWTGWIGMHEKRKRAVLDVATSPRAAFLGLLLVGLTAVYREGFEVVLFLQSVRLQAGDATIGAGVAIGLSLTAIVAVLTFVGQHRLPFKRLLVVTGAMIVGVLLVMVGASGQAMQQAGWLAATPIDVDIPAWLGAWFGIYPTIEGLAAQAFAATLIIGSYVAARRSSRIAASA